MINGTGLGRRTEWNACGHCNVFGSTTAEEEEEEDAAGIITEVKT